MKYRIYQCNISYSSKFITQCPLYKAKSVNENKQWRAASQPHACELHSPSVVVWLLGEGLCTFTPWSHLACFCTSTVLGLVPSPDRRRLGVSDLERVLCRSSVDRSVVCRTLVFPLSSFFGLSTDFPSPLSTSHLCGPHVNLCHCSFPLNLNCIHYLLFCALSVCTLCTLSHWCIHRCDVPESDSVNKIP